MHPVANCFGLLDTTIYVGFVDFNDEHARIVREVPTRYINTYIPQHTIFVLSRNFLIQKPSCSCSGASWNILTISIFNLTNFPFYKAIYKGWKFRMERFNVYGLGCERNKRFFFHAMNEFNGVEIVEENIIDFPESYKDWEPFAVEDT